jgi:hypothetical protein
VTARPRPLDAQHELLEQVLAELRALRAAVQGLLRARAALDAGRARAIADKRRKGSYTRTLVLELAAAEQQAGRGGRGLAGRVTRKLQGQVSEAHVRKILSSTQSNARDSVVSNSAKGDDECTTRTS